MEVYTRDEALAIAQTIGLMLLAVGFAASRRGALSPPRSGHPVRPRGRLRRLLREIRRIRGLTWFLVGSQILAAQTIILCIGFVGLNDQPAWYSNVIRWAMMFSMPGLAGSLAIDLSEHWLSRSDAAQDD